MKIKGITKINGPCKLNWLATTVVIGFANSIQIRKVLWLVLWICCLYVLLRREFICLSIYVLLSSSILFLIHFWLCFTIMQCKGIWSFSKVNAVLLWWKGEQCPNHSADDAKPIVFRGRPKSMFCYYTCPIKFISQPNLSIV